MSESLKKACQNMSIAVAMNMRPKNASEAEDLCIKLLDDFCASASRGVKPEGPGAIMTFGSEDEVHISMIRRHLSMLVSFASLGLKVYDDYQKQKL